MENGNFLQYLHALIVLKMKGIKHGNYPYIVGQTPIISNKGEFNVGHNFRIICTQFKTQITCSEGAKLEIGNSVFINQGANIYAGESVKMGDHVLIADLVMISDSNFHKIEENKPVPVKPLIISDNVWIGARSIVLPGVEIGRNSVVAAGSIVTKSVPPNTLVAGVPAKKIRQLDCSDNFVRK